MQEIVHQKGKIYYSMGEVAEMFDVRPSLLRYWEQEFDILKPHRNKKGNRLFTPQDVDNIKIIYHLLKEKKMKIEVARKYIKEQKKEMSRDAEIVERLTAIRAMLMQIKQDMLRGEPDEPDEEDSAVYSLGDINGGQVDDYGGTFRKRPSRNEAEIAALEESLKLSGDSLSAPREEEKPPFEEQMLFQVLGKGDMLERLSVNERSDADTATGSQAGHYGSYTSPATEGTEPRIDGQPARETAPEEEGKKITIIEQTLF